MLNICLQNLGKYNEGVLDFKWVELPCDESEIDEALKAIGIGAKRWDGGVYEEYHMPDWECDIPGLKYSEWANPNELNEIAEAWEGLRKDEQKVVSYILDNDSSVTFEEAVEEAEKGDVCYLDGIESHRELGEYCALEYYPEEFANAPELFRNYFDFEAFGRDLCYGEYTLVDGGAIIDMR